MKKTRQCEIYLTDEEIGLALRQYLASCGKDIAAYPKGPLIYSGNHEDGEDWRLVFYEEEEVD